MTRRLREGSFSVKAIPKASAATAGAKGSRRLANGRFRSIARKEGAAAATFTLRAGALRRGEQGFGFGMGRWKRWVWCGELAARRVENVESENWGQGFTWEKHGGTSENGGREMAILECFRRGGCQNSTAPSLDTTRAAQETEEKRPKCHPSRNKETERQIKGSEITMRMTQARKGFEGHGTPVQ